tara:strand:+ start:153 stop:584 length:432 start_codon:yes stop_codon:yes gene_type:complete
MEETPKFKSDEEFFAWTFKKISESITNLAKRIEKVEEGMQKIPPPGADMVKYRIPGNQHYSNLKELFGTIFQRIEEQKGLRSDSEWRVGRKIEQQTKVFDKALEVKESIMDAESIDQMIQIRISDQLEVLDQRLNKIESKLGI